MEITASVFVIWITAILILSLSLVLLLGSNKLTPRVFAWMLLLLALWTADIGFLSATTNYLFAKYLLRLALFFGSGIASSFLYLSNVFPDDKKPSKTLFWLLILLQTLLSFIYFFTNFIDAGPVKLPSVTPSGIWGWNDGPFYFLFELQFFGSFLFGILLLCRKYFFEQRRIFKQNIKFMIIAVVVGLITPSIFSVVLPNILQTFEYNWLGPISGLLWVPIMSYSIIRYRQMDVKIVITEVLAIAMAGIFFINIFIDIPFGTGGRTVTFAMFLILAYYLIRSALRESKQKELLADLNLNLSEKVAEQTVEIRRSYDLEKKARRELEKLNETKDQFIMITQHHLRTPVTSIRWGLEEALKGTYGATQPELRKALEDTNTAANRLQRIVDDFLSITALKVGSQILNISPTSMKPLLEDVLTELRYDIENKRLKVSYSKESESWPELRIDAPKMREVILIIVENAVRYNIEGGSITIGTRVDGGKFEMIIGNTGIGLSQEDREKIFTSLFYRGDSAKVAHPIGMGVGLSVSRAIVRAHHGELTLESGGEGKGAKVTMGVPFA